MPNGKFCFSSNTFGGSFNLGHSGGAFNGEGFNPFPGSQGVPGGLLVGSIGEASDVSRVVTSFVQKLSTADLSLQQLKSTLNEMQEYVAELENGNSPMATPAPEPLE